MNEYSDVISFLPVDKTPLTGNEIHVMNKFFQEEAKSKFGKLCSGLKDVLFIGLFFFVFCLPWMDELIKKIFPSTQNSTYILLSVKTCIFMVVYFVFMNWVLCKKM